MPARVVEAQWVDPVRALRASTPFPGRVLLDSGGALTRLSRWSVLALDPLETIRERIGAGRSGEERFPDPFQPMEQLYERWRGRAMRDRGRSAGELGVLASAQIGEAEADSLPFTGGVIALLGYDLGRALERMPVLAQDDPIVPDLWAAVYDGAIVFDRFRRKTWVTSWGLAGSQGPQRLIDLLEAARGPEGELRDPASRAASPGAIRSPRARGDTAPADENGFLRGVLRIQEEISRGEIYQANLTRRVVHPLDAAAGPSVYERLRAGSPTPFGAFLDAGEFQLLSASPERFVTISNGIVETRPIKGTRPRGTGPGDDARLRAELLNSEKDRAELLMIVDLERNDLGRVCETGSVMVADHPSLEGYSTVWHLVASVKGRLATHATVCDVLRASFPGGSISGAPKIRAMQILEELEPFRRKFAMGSLLAWDLGGRVDSSILIRTIVIRAGEAVFHVGGGIVADSVPEEEYRETLAKAAPLVGALEGV